MNGEFVADSSIGVAWTVASHSSEATRRLLDEVAAGAVLHVPALWAFEVANTLLVLGRRKRLTPEECLDGRRILSDLSLTVDEEGLRLAFGEISRLAEKYTLSIYDAAYLELAVRRGIPLASRDNALNSAAKLSGVKTLL